MAAARYPSEYAWPYITVSSLVYADRDPRGYLFARAGLALCALAGIFWSVLLRRAGRRDPAAVLALGYACMLGCALLPDGPAPIPKAHDFLAVCAFLLLCSGLSLWLLESRARGTAKPTGSAWRARVHVMALWSPILAAGLSQIYIAHARPHLPWVGIAWRAQGVPIYLSFALWEWVMCALLSLSMLSLSRDAADPG